MGCAVELCWYGRMGLGVPLPHLIADANGAPSTYLRAPIEHCLVAARRGKALVIQRLLIGAYQHSQPV